MSSFKDFMESDMKSFFNSEEFAERHRINGEDKLITLDQDLLESRKIKYAEGTYSGNLLFSIKKTDLQEKPQEESIMSFDGEPMRVKSVQEDMGIYVITLEATLS